MSAVWALLSPSRCGGQRVLRGRRVCGHATRRSQVEPLADRRARYTGALHALQHVSLMLAICQLGDYGRIPRRWASSPNLRLHASSRRWNAWALPKATSLIGFAAALIIVLFCHVVFGEMVPKNVSIAARRYGCSSSPPSSCAGHVLRPIIGPWTFRELDHLSGYEPRSEISASYTVEGRSPPSSSPRRPRASSPTNWGCSAAPWDSQKKPQVRRWWQSCGCHPPTWRNESLIPAARYDCGRGRCHRRLCHLKDVLASGEGAQPLPVAHPPPRGRHSSDQVEDATAPHAAHRRALRSCATESSVSSWRISWNFWSAGSATPSGDPMATPGAARAGIAAVERSKTRE